MKTSKPKMLTLIQIFYKVQDNLKDQNKYIQDLK